jgi:hypothetical protein
MVQLNKTLIPYLGLLLWGGGLRELRLAAAHGQP